MYSNIFCLQLRLQGLKIGQKVQINAAKIANEPGPEFHKNLQLISRLGLNALSLEGTPENNLAPNYRSND